MDEHKRQLGTILAVDDVADNLELLSTLLTCVGYTVRTTTNGAFALQVARSAPPDLVLLDIRMPGMDGFAVCRQLKDDPSLRDIPVIFISALHEIEDKVKAFAAGGVDYLTKPFHEAEVLARVRTHITLYRMQTRLEELVGERNADLVAKTQALQAEIEERKRVEEELRTAEFRYRTVADFTYAWEYWEGPDGTFHYISPSCMRVSGYPAEAFTNDPGLLSRIVEDADRAAWEEHRREAATGCCPHKLEFRIRAADGTLRWIDHTCQTVTDADGRFLGFRVSNRDISAHKELEREMRQAQKMEAIGTLAGGIAHDFNNILSCIFGYAELALTDDTISPHVREYLEIVFDSARRAKELVRQILTMSRRADQEVKPLRMYLIVKEAMKLLRASLPASIAIEQEIDAQEYVLADPTQIHQVVMNLCTNAFHAMREKGGTLAVSLRREVFGPDDAPPCLDFSPGVYLALVVKDTGHGMDETTVEKIFDPYFTTKAPGEGTGLGLSVVAGIVKNFKGHITVRSAPGSGTAFFVYLPVLPDGNVDLSRAGAALPMPAPLPGTERIMVVDDEKDVLALYQSFLSQSGYTVTAFANPQEAFTAFRRDPSAVDLVLSDVIMPEFDGIELTMRLLAIRPDLPVLLCTGQGDALSRERLHAAGAAELIQKPFTQHSLLRAIRDIFDKRTHEP
jgi:PAS domain S-box-containing protein